MSEVLSNLSLSEVFISYAFQNRARVSDITNQLEASGVAVWRDQDQVLGGGGYGPQIVQGIKQSKVLLLMCSDASLRSKNVKQEIQLAWKYGVPYLPLLLEPVSYPEQVEYWLEGWQWIEVLDLPAEAWLPKLLQSLTRIGIRVAGDVWQEFSPETTASGAESPLAPNPHLPGLAGLLALACYTDQIWPIPAGTSHRGLRGFRDLGAAQEDARRRVRLGERVRLVIESDWEGHLLLLDIGTSGKVYCLCPSAFAPETRIQPGCLELPQSGSRYDAFTVTGLPGREQVLAILTREPLGLDWLPTTESKTPARILNQQDIDVLLTRLQAMENDRWLALATYLNVVP